MGLAGLLKAGWRNLVTSSRMDRMGLLAMGRTAKAVMAEYIYLLEEPILSLIGGNFVNL